MLRRLAYLLLGVTWLALAFALERLTLQAAPWFIRNIPEHWIEHYMTWYGATGAESTRDAEFLLFFSLCLILTGSALAVPFVVARLTARPRAQTVSSRPPTPRSTDH